MIQTAEKVIEIIKTLPKTERKKVRDWIDENQEPVEIAADNTKFRQALQWIEENKEEYDGKWVVLDGDKLISHGKDAKTVYDEARAKGIKSPFLERVKAKVLPWGGW